MLFVTFAAFVLCPAKALDVYLAELAAIGNPVNDDVNVSVLGFAFVISYQAEFDFFEVVDYRHYGSFVDWGLPKDLLVPLSEQKSHFSIGKSYLLRVCLDELTGRLYGSQRIGRWLENGFGKVSKYQKVDLFTNAKTPMGYKAIIDGKYEGMIFSSDVFEYIKEFSYS